MRCEGWRIRDRFLRQFLRCIVRIFGIWNFFRLKRVYMHGDLEFFYKNSDVCMYILTMRNYINSKLLNFNLIILVLSIVTFVTSRNYESWEGSQNIDRDSFANVDEVITTHFELKLEIDFDHRVLRGLQQLQMTKLAPRVDQVYLDIRDLKVYEVYGDHGEPLNYAIDNPNPMLGQRLAISLSREQASSKDFAIYVQYETATNASALSWLAPQQTSGKTLPYLFTQCQTIHARSMAPLQDTPSVKSTFVVETLTEPAIQTRVTGNMTHNQLQNSSGVELRFTRHQIDIPIQSYLLAIASGNLAERKIGDRTTVISEPEDLDKVANEFVQLEQFLDVAENLTIPYEWGEYKLLILPPSFPLGGMENPLLTFASPAIVPGDRSSVDVAIHELAHSWFGNLVTNNNWTNFWLNEGFTVFLERKVVKKIFGEDFYKVTAKLENQTMYFDMLDFGLDNDMTSLSPSYDGIHPDECFSDIPYEKGFQFLTFIESVIGEETMLDMLRAYLREFQKTSIGVDDFESYFSSYLEQRFGSDDARRILDTIDFNTWVHGTGLPPVAADFETKEYNEAIELAQNFIDTTPDAEKAAALYKSFSVNLKGLFISHLIDNLESLNQQKTQYIDDVLSVSSEINGEIIYRWLQVSIRSGQLQAPFTLADEFLGSIGRMKFVVPVYAAINAINPSKAREIYAKYEDFYHSMARDAITAVLKSEDVLISS
ncbi:unnamed protein product [Moneuplotes crassus]|uniref:Peptidase M1 leukotriene A4 hydrolase/aminopeptidase C-terminal domain-containing protein n=2 Tax=Euplotes crassus TaxID=5936 RepID=A0AAD1TZD9_EUPCR|nr:unnamed protein product [Moneuplotes crassus]